jgi:Acetyltransferase (GNAT) domain
LEWSEEVPADAQAVAALAHETLRAFPNLGINQDVDWLSALRTTPDKSLLILSVRRNGLLAGLAPFEVNSTSLQFALGELTFMRKRVRRFALESHPLMRDLQPPVAISDCFAALAQRLPANAAVFLRGVAETSPLHALLEDRRSSLRASYYVVPHGPRYLRCRVLWDGSYERYLTTLGKKTRKNLADTLKKLDREYGQRIRFVRYVGAESLPEFHSHACRVSETTYQARLLGLGLSRSGFMLKYLQAAAARGYFLGFVLFIDDQPVAFDYGYIFNRCFSLVEGGYDPAWSKAQVGSYNFVRILKDFEAHAVPVSTLDYLYGDNTFKIRTSNSAVPERHYYLFKKSVAGAILASAMLATDVLSRSLGGLLEKYGLKEKLKRLIRRRAL